MIIVSSDSCHTVESGILYGSITFENDTSAGIIEDCIDDLGDPRVGSLYAIFASIL